MKTLLACLFSVLTCAIAIGQDKNPVEAGQITLISHATFQFTDLRFEGMEVAFKNETTKSKSRYMLESVQRIVDSNNNVVYARHETEQEKIARTEASAKAKRDSIALSQYPEGIYKTKEDFLNKTPTDLASVGPYTIMGSRRPIVGVVANNCYFYYLASDVRVRKAFAVSYKGNLYFQVNAILDNRNKYDRAQSPTWGQSFSRVIMGGENYFYVEASLANAWAQGAAYGSGGVAGAAIGSSLMSAKGIVWDFKNGEFNIFKNCDDYNEFIEPIHRSGVQACHERQPDLSLVRAAMQVIK